MISISIDDIGIFIPYDPGLFFIIKMLMAMDKIAGRIFVKQCVETLEPAVADIAAVAKSERRGVGHQYVKSLVPPDLRRKPSDPPGHLFFGILEVLAVIHVASTQAKNPDTLIHQEFAFYRDAALRGMLCIILVMIAVDIKERGMDHCDEEGKILRFQIAA